VTIDTEVTAALQKRKRYSLSSGTEVVDIYGSVDGGFMMALDGRLFEWSMEFEEKEVTDPVRRRLALSVGCEAVPELRHLLPPRPAQAEGCTACQGSGRAKLNEQMSWVCNTCGGVGWVETP
jgi:hypothetical protein